VKHFLSLRDYSAEELVEIFDRAAELRRLGFAHKVVTEPPTLLLN
jgi:hypothetical protein